jgi:hypothetical protein
MSTEPSKPTATAKPEWPKPPFTKPKTWPEIDRGSLVIAFESYDDGWWEAVVISKTADQYTIVFRDYAQQGEYVRNSSQIALLKP